MIRQEKSNRNHKSPVYSKIQKATTMRLDQQGISIITKRQSSKQKSQKILKTGQANSNLSSNEFKIDSKLNSNFSVSNTSLQQNDKTFQIDAKSNLVAFQTFTQQDVKNKSNFTEMIGNNSQTTETKQQKIIQQKNPVKNVKFCINQQSHVPTSSSSTQNLDLNKKLNQEILSQYYQNTCKQLSKYNQQQKAKANSDHFPQRIKSLNYIRSKSIKKDSSLQKYLKSQAKTLKLIDNNTAAIQNTTQQKPQGKRKIIKIKPRHNIPTDDINLKLSSRLDDISIDRNDIVEKIQLHLQLLNQLAIYVQKFKQIYQETDGWQELIFLTYKKFYIERLKVQLALSDKPIRIQYKNLMPINPFKFTFCQIDNKELRSFRNSLNALKIQTRLQQQNKQILNALRNLYNLFIEKSGKHINLYLIDNFSQQIYILMHEQIKLLQQNINDSLESIRWQRINKIIKCCLIIASLNGINLNIASLITADDSSKDLLLKFEKFMQILNK